MFLKLLKGLWIAACLSVLVGTLYFYDGKELSDVWVFLTMLMLVLSFPVGGLVSLGHAAVGTIFAITIQTSYLSLGFEWLAYFVLGYFQWFWLVPYLASKLKSRVARRKSSYISRSTTE